MKIFICFKIIFLKYFIINFSHLFSSFNISRIFIFMLSFFHTS